MCPLVESQAAPCEIRSIRVRASTLAGCASRASTPATGADGRQMRAPTIRGTREPVALECYRRSHKIALAELDAAMAQDVVGGGGVKIEILAAGSSAGTFAN